MSNLATLRPFPKGYKSGNHTQKHPDGYLTCHLKNLLLKKKFRYEDPETQKIMKMSGAKALPLVYIWQGL